VITSAANQHLKLIRRLESRAQRARLGLFVAEGEDLVEAALGAGIRPVTALVDAERPVLERELRGAELCLPKLLAEVSTLAHPPRIIAIFRDADLPRLDVAAAIAATPASAADTSAADTSGADMPSEAAAGADMPSGAAAGAAMSRSGIPKVGLALWHVGDPGNVGTLFRAADALGPAFVALSEGCADPAGAKALRGSTGSVFRVPRCGFEEAPGRRIGLVARAGKALSEIDLADGDLFVLGAERAGLPDSIRRSCDMLAEIPLAGAADSLNVAMAGTIALYEWSRSRS
jgi:TrmH family RNA methyltransferase